jgi:predicted ATPase
VRLSTEYGYTIGQAIGDALAGWAQVMLGDYPGGLALLEQGMIQWQAAGMHTMQTYLFALWIEACCTAGRFEEGIAHADQAHGFIVEYGEQFFAPEIYRLRGELFRARGDLETAESCYAQALSVAREQSAKSLELRAAVRLARAWQDQGRHRDAYDLLAPIYAWFHEGFDTPDLRTAHDLLAELAL